MARFFNASTDIVDTGTWYDSVSNAAVPARSYSVWFYATSVPSTNLRTHAIFGNNSWDASAAGSGFFLRNFNGNPRLLFTENMGADGVGGTINVSLGVGAWHNAVATYDSTAPASNGVMYLDGAVDVPGWGFATWQSGGGIGNLTVGNAGTSGSAPLGADDPLPGAVADAAIWNVILTATEAAALARGARPWTIRPANLLIVLPLFGLVGPEPDLSGNQHNGTLNGTAFTIGPPLMQFTPRRPQWTEIAAPPSIIGLHQVAAHFQRRVNVIGY